MRDERVQHIAGAKNRWLAGGKWTLPDDVLIQTARAYLTSGYEARDAWGRTLKLVKRPAKEKNTTGHSVFDHLVLTSAGPDGKVGTADDLTYAREGQGGEGAGGEEMTALHQP